MEKMKIVYVYDAHCSWCFAFSDVIKELEEKYKEVFDFEVLSGGMVIGDKIGDIAKTIDPKQLLPIYERITTMTGAKFGEKYLDKIRSGKSYANSVTPAIALSVFKSYGEERAVEFAHALQSKMFQEAKAVNDDDLYRSLAIDFGIDGEEFLAKMKDEAFEAAARYEFALSRQLQVTAYPQVLVQATEQQFYLISKGYTDFPSIDSRVQSVMKEFSK
jgi:putative protein-disulfide isomerase